MSVAQRQDFAVAGSACEMGVAAHLRCKPAGFSNPAIFSYRQLLRNLSSLTIAEKAIGIFPGIRTKVIGKSATNITPVPFFGAPVPRNPHNQNNRLAFAKA